MNNTDILSNITFNLSSVSHAKVGKEWNYPNVISSFSRLYLVTQGEAYVFIGDKKIRLKKGFLYLIPSFRHCSYVCKEEMEHYYATFTIQLPNHISLYQLFNFQYEVEALPEHYDYFKKLCKINPNMALPAQNPNIYQKTNSGNWNLVVSDAHRSLSTSGILHLLISNFIGKAKINLNAGDSNTILQAIKYIHTHLTDNLTVASLAEMSFLSVGHFARKFKQQTQLAPTDYITKQRIEKAQFLLNTSMLSGIEIADACGFKSNAYFCKTFKKQVGLTPGEFRKNQV